MIHARWCGLSSLLFWMLIALPAAQAGAQYIEEFKRLGPMPKSEAADWLMPVEAGESIALTLSCHIEMGELVLKAGLVDGETPVHQSIGVGKGTVQHLLGPFEKDGQLLVSVIPHAATGLYSIQALPASRSYARNALALQGGLMLLGGLVLALWGWRRSGAGLVWLAAGAGVWFLGQLLDTVFRWRLEVLLRDWLLQYNGAGGFRAGMAAFEGLASAIFLVGIFGAVAMAWEPLAKDRERCLAAAAGATAMGLLLTGLARLWFLIPILANFPAARFQIATAASLRPGGPLPVLAHPTALILLALVVFSARYLVLRGTACGKPAWLIGGLGQAFVGVAVVQAPQFANPLLLKHSWWSTLFIAVLTLPFLLPFATRKLSSPKTEE